VLVYDHESSSCNIVRPECIRCTDVPRRRPPTYLGRANRRFGAVLAEDVSEDATDLADGGIARTASRMGYMRLPAPRATSFRVFRALSTRWLSRSRRRACSRSICACTTSGVGRCRRMGALSPSSKQFTPTTRRAPVSTDAGRRTRPRRSPIAPTPSRSRPASRPSPRCARGSASPLLRSEP